MKYLVLFVGVLGAYGATIPSIEDSCPLPDANGVSTFTIPVDSPIGRFNMLLIKFDVKRKLTISSTALHDALNVQKLTSRTAEPFGPLKQTCSSLLVPSPQLNCTGGISMTDAQKAKATPRYTWDRGHMTPANPMRFSDDALNKTFYCVNIAPQDSWTNQNAWKDIELFTENKLKVTNGYVMTGLCSADNAIDGPTTYKGYTIPQCYWKLACYKDQVTQAPTVVGYIGDNTIVNFADLVAQADRTATTSTPRSQSEILALLKDPTVVAQGWRDAVTSLLPGRQVAPSALPTADQCISATTITTEISNAWKV